MPLKHGVLFAFLYPSLCIGRLSENGPWRLAPLGSWSQPGHGELVNWIRRSWGSLNWGEFLFFRFCSTPIQWPSSWLQEMAALPLLLVTLLLGDVPGHWPKSLSNNRWGGGKVGLLLSDSWEKTPFIVSAHWLVDGEGTSLRFQQRRQLGYQQRHDFGKLGGSCLAHRPFFPHHEISLGIFLCLSHLGHLGLLSSPTCSSAGHTNTQLAF